jgi:GT2 family glycosyltransferase
MNIASVTVTFNDIHSIDNWWKHYQGYKDDIHTHIIVDNGSEREYLENLKEKFASSVIIGRNINGGTTAAYNDGIKYALGVPEIDSILLVANDIKLDRNTLTELHRLLFYDIRNGMVGPVLLKGKSNLIESYGTIIRRNLTINRLYHSEELTNKLPETLEVDLLPGGMNLAKREIYEKVGLQDESLFMYGDETDFDIRVKQEGYKIIVTKRAIAMHQHINTNYSKYGSDQLWYYNNRNIILLNYRYSDSLMALRTFLYLFIPRGLRYIIGFSSQGEFRKLFLYFAGLFAGLFRYRKNWL